MVFGLSLIPIYMCCMPDYLILDEPVDGLDPVMRRQVWSLIMQDVAERGTTVLLSLIHIWMIQKLGKSNRSRLAYCVKKRDMACLLYTSRCV